MNDFDDSEARRIAEELAQKYGGDAIDYVRDRTERAMEVGDDVALSIWRKVMCATTELLRR